MRWWSTGDPVDVRPTAIERFWSKLDRQPFGCWLWLGTKTSEGYGQIGVNGHTVGTHRYAYELFYGPIPAGLHLDHLCRNPPCCNPDHLEPVTPGENIMRSPIAPTAVNARKILCVHGHLLDGVRGSGGRYCKTCERERYRSQLGRPVGVHNADKTHCKRGHEFTPENTRVESSGSRRCLTCVRAARRRSRAAARVEADLAR